MQLNQLLWPTVLTTCFSLSVSASPASLDSSLSPESLDVPLPPESSLSSLSPESSVSSQNLRSQSRAPAPIFPYDTWKNYVESHNYKDFPGLFGFDPLRDPKSGEIKTSPVLADKYGVNVPIVIRCDDPNGCVNYKVEANPANVAIIYQDKTALIHLLTNSLNTVEFPADLAGHAPHTFDIGRYPPRPPTGGTCGKDGSCYGGYSENDAPDTKGKKPGYCRDAECRDLVTPYKGIMAILHLNKDKLLPETPMDPRGPILFESWRNGQNDYSFDFPGLRVSAQPYLENGYVWKLIDTGVPGPRSSWKRIEKFKTGLSHETSEDISLEVGGKVGFDIEGISAEVTSTLTQSWGQKWINNTEHASETEMMCNNELGDTPLACAIYQKYGSTRLVVPGMEENNFYFKIFNNDDHIKNHFFTLHLGMSGSENMTDDTQEPLGVIYPVAGTLEPEGNLNTAQPNIPIPVK